MLSENKQMLASMPRIGVYLCHCGVNIAGTVDIPALTEFSSHLPGVVIARDYTYMCSDPGQVLIQNDIHELSLERVVVASCSPRMHEPTFRAAVAGAGLNPHFFEMANIREQCSWVHPAEPPTTLKAMQLVASAVAKARYLEALETRQAPVTPAALVIGGGIAGMQAALDIAEAGFKVVLVERATKIGGHTLQLHRTFPTLEPAAELMAEMVQSVQSHSNIQVLTAARVTDIQGYVGNFRITVTRSVNPTPLEATGPVGSTHPGYPIDRDIQEEHPAGAIIVATGFETFDPRAMPELGYGVYSQVVTTLDFERKLASDLAVNGTPPQSVVFIQCVGSRDRNNGHPYCSRVCCMVTARQAHWVRQRLPDAQITVFYMDVRAYGKGFEEYYDHVRSQGVIYRRGNPSEIIQRGNQVVVRAEDTLLGEPVEVEADLVVLAIGMQPHQDTGALAGLLKLARTADGFFMEAHPKLRPVDTSMAGIFLAGCCQGPKDISESIAQARAAASAAMAPLMRGQVTIEAATSFIDEQLCAGCGQCANVCAFGALNLHPVKGVMIANPILCQGCGACAATCPSGAINVHQFTFDQFSAQIQALSVC